MLTLADAQILAKQIKAGSRKVVSIELFGSVLKNGRGHDADLILIVAEELSDRFWPQVSNTGVKWVMPPMFVRRFIKRFFFFIDKAFSENKRSRQLWASKLIEFDIDLRVDPWLVPPDWRSRIAQLTPNRNMRVILKRAASTAIRLV